MILNCTFSNLEVLTKNVFQGKPKPDGTCNTYYQLGVSNGTEIGELNCTLDVYNKVVPKNCYNFGYKLNTRFQNIFLKLDSVEPCK